MSNRKTGAAIIEFMDHPSWNEFMALERKFYEDNLLKAVKVDLNDPNYALKVAYANGQAMAIIDLWQRRETLKNHVKHTNQGDQDANNEE